MAFRELEKIVVSDRWIDEYRREHISRAFEVRLKGGLIKPRHPHRNYPYCNICDGDYEEWDVGYRLYVGGRPVVYHVDCIEASGDTGKVKNILAQDRGFRRRLEGVRDASRELALRAQMYRFVIGSVLDDTLGSYAPSERDSRSQVGPLMPVGGLEVPVSALCVDGVAEGATRDAARGTVTG
jgi:hypothetical protein